MKLLTASICVASLLALTANLYGEIPDLEEGVYILDNGLPLEVGSFASTPDVVDWNNDKRKDLVIGQCMYGNIWLFLNQGTDLNPVFRGGTKIESGGQPIATTCG